MVGVSRRNFVKCGGAAGAAALAGCLGEEEEPADDVEDEPEGERPLQVIGPAWALMDDQIEQYEDHAGVEVSTSIHDQPTTTSQLLGGDNEIYDAFAHSVGAGVESIVLDNELSQPIDVDELDNWDTDSIADVLLNPSEVLSHLDGQYEIYEEMMWVDPEERQELNFPPTAYNFDALGSNPEYVEPGLEREWSDLFDDQYQGEVAMTADPALTIIEALMHMADNDMVDISVGDINNPGPDYIDEAVDFLIDQREAGQFRATWTAYGDSVNMMAGEEAVIGDLWQPAAFDVRRSGTPCEYATMVGGIQGYRYWYGGIAPVVPGVNERNNLGEVKQFINDVHWGAWYPGFVAASGYSVPHYPNTDLVRDGEDEIGDGMGPEYYDWAYEGAATYEAVEQEYLFDPAEYDWSMEEGDEHDDGAVRDSGPIEERIERIGAMQAWPDEETYMLERFDDFEAA